MNLLSIQIKEEFRRITTISLEQSFMYKLDHYTPKLIALMKAKGGVVGTKLRPFLDKLSQVCLFKIVLVHIFCRETDLLSHSLTHSHRHTHACTLPLAYAYTAQIIALGSFYAPACSIFPHMAMCGEMEHAGALYAQITAPCTCMLLCFHSTVHCV